MDGLAALGQLEVGVQSLLGFAVFVGPYNQALARRDLGAFREPPFARVLFAVGQEFAGQIDLTVGGVHDLDVVIEVTLGVFGRRYIFRDDLVDRQHGVAGLGRHDAKSQRLGLGTCREEVGGHFLAAGTSLYVVADLFAGELRRNGCGKYAAVRLVNELHRHLVVRLVFAVGEPEDDRLGQSCAGGPGLDADGVG